LIDIERPTDVTGPLASFQATKLRDKADMKKLIESIAKAGGDRRSAELLKGAVDDMWARFEGRVNKELQLLDDDGSTGRVAPRTSDDKLDELLGMVRESVQSESATEGQLELINALERTSQSLTALNERLNRIALAHGTLLDRVAAVEHLLERQVRTPRTPPTPPTPPNGETSRTTQPHQRRVGGATIRTSRPI
jgi:hypothetical protein